MLFLGVFDLVMADALQRLHEHHDGGNAGSGDFGRIVERTGWKTMRPARDFLDGLLAALDQRGMELDGLDVPDPRPLDSAFLLPGETLAGFASLAIHAGQHP